MMNERMSEQENDRKKLTQIDNRIGLWATQFPFYTLLSYMFILFLFYNRVKIKYTLFQW